MGSSTAPPRFPHRPAKTFYQPELDTLRFLAFLLVYLSHTLPSGPDAPHWLAAFSKSGALGVPVFFTLSAYLITELLMREKELSGTCDVRAFYVRRVLRIWPLYFLVLGCGFAVSHLRGANAISVRALGAYLLFSGNWYSILRVPLPWGLSPLWSISVEEQFYLLWPLLVRRVSRRTLLAVCATAWGLSQVTTLYLCSRHVRVEINLWFNSLVQLQYFALGAAVSLVLRGTMPAISPSSRAGMIAASAALLYGPLFLFPSVVTLDSKAILGGYFVLLCCSVASPLLLLGFLGSAYLGSLRFLRFLGAISYGLYVYHLLVMLLLSRISVRLTHSDHDTLVKLAAFPVTILVATLSYRYFEKPFLRLKKRFELVPSKGPA